MDRTRLPALVLLAALAAAAPGRRPAAGQDAPPKGGGLGLGEEPPKELTPEERRAAMDLFAKAKDLVARGQGIPARRLFEEFLDRFPGADEDLLREADDRSGPNFLAGIELQHEGGPPARRIDVELMGDGYTLDIFRRFKGDALSQMKEFWAEPLYAEYASYFNVWRFDLVSFEGGVDDVSQEDRGIPPPDDPKKLKRWKKAEARMKQYSTALDCKAAGPARQVWANPEQVMRWRRYLEASDGLTIAFANKGELGMGGGGIATTGKKVAVVHEFGHAFVGLLDEYVNNPERPQGRIFAANAVSTESADPREKPPIDEIPWKHWLLHRPRPADVDVLLGGATYAQGVFRPAPSCAMNSGGSAKMCTVCREAGVLRIYSYVSPIDESGPAADTVRMTSAEAREFFVVPMAPKSHPLQASWTLQVLQPGPPAAGADPAPPPDPVSVTEDDRARGMGRAGGDRGAERRANPLPEGTPRGAPVKPVVSKAGAGAFRSAVKLEKLPPGIYRLTARVLDDTRIPGSPIPWVIKDPDRLREEWRSWTVEVQPAGPASSPVPTPGPGGPAPPAPAK